MTSATNIPFEHATSIRKVLRGTKSSFFPAFRLLEPERREALFRIYAFFRIADDCVDEISDPENAKIALSFWRERLDRLYDKNADHPVMTELGEAIARYGIPKEYLAGLLDGCEMDLQKNRYASFSELYEYCYRVAGLVGLSSMKIFGHRTPTSEQAAVDLGVAFQLTNILRDVGTDLALGRIYIPTSFFTDYGYSEDELKAGIENDAFKRIMHRLWSLADSYYRKAAPEFSRDPSGRLAAAALMTAAYRRILDKIREENFPVLKRRVSLSFKEKWGFMMPAWFGRAPQINAEGKAA